MIRRRKEYRNLLVNYNFILFLKGYGNNLVERSNLRTKTTAIRKLNFRIGTSTIEDQIIRCFTMLYSDRHKHVKSTDRQSGSPALYFSTIYLHAERIYRSGVFWEFKPERY
jgi:hypothetical protein